MFAVFDSASCDVAKAAVRWIVLTQTFHEKQFRMSIKNPME